MFTLRRIALAAIFSLLLLPLPAHAETSATTTYYACLSKGKLTKVGTTSPTCTSPAKVISWNTPTNSTIRYYACLSKGVLSKVSTKAPKCVTTAKKISWLSGVTTIGVPGPQGPAGPAGAVGATGPAGPAGATGPAGPAGADGSNGSRGPAGPAGAPGTNGIAGAPGEGYDSITSTTSVAIASGNKTFTVNKVGALAVGSRVRVASSADTSKYMEGVITTIASLAVTVNVDKTSGSGTIASWNVSIAGEPGADGQVSVIYYYTNDKFNGNPTTNSSKTSTGVTLWSNTLDPGKYLIQSSLQFYSSNSTGLTEKDFSITCELVYQGVRQITSRSTGLYGNLVAAGATLSRAVTRTTGTGEASIACAVRYAANDQTLGAALPATFDLWYEITVAVLPVNDIISVS